MLCNNFVKGVKFSMFMFVRLSVCKKCKKVLFYSDETYNIASWMIFILHQKWSTLWHPTPRKGPKEAKPSIKTCSRATVHV